jgi:hypothetical protein
MSNRARFQELQQSHQPDQDLFSRKASHQAVENLYNRVTLIFLRLLARPFLRFSNLVDCILLAEAIVINKWLQLVCSPLVESRIRKNGVSLIPGNDVQNSSRVEARQNSDYERGNGSNYLDGC